ncbi:MAG TPA: Uma2 family endonuclease [Pyrinomonadaceae bacterium]|nr:Uma2 family endonuclease [Pyrinomonadaceae bacterium]
MTTVLEPPKVKEVLTDGVLLHNISWSTYESLLKDQPDSASPRFTYDRGDLLIMVTSRRHEEINRALELLVQILAEQFRIESRGLGSTTFKCADLQRGFEPDCCFYFKNEARMRQKNDLDLSVDPPPDLVVEVDISNSSPNKTPLFASFGVPEVWRFDGENLEIQILQDGQYFKSDHSLALPKVRADIISAFINEGLRIGRLEWIQKIRAWAREAGAANPQ